MRFDSAPDRHRWLSNNSMMVAAKLATSPKSNWTSVKIGDVVEKISTGTTPPSQERRYYDGDIDWYTPSDIGGVRWLTNPKKTITSEAVNEKKARMFDAGTILITCIGQIGRVGILPKESSSNQQITGVKFISEIDPEFAYFSLFAKQDELEAAAPTASTLSILNQNRLSEIDFSYPSTKEQKQIAKFLAWCEDRLLNSKPFTNDFPALPNYLNDLPRIVAYIESLAARVNEAQRLRKEAEKESHVLLASALEHSFPEDNSKGIFQYQLLKDSIIEHKQGYYESGKPPHGDIYFARITDITNDGYLNYDGMPRISVDNKTLETYRVKPNDFVFARTGGAGRFALATKELDCVFASYLIRFRFKDEYLTEFLRYYFWSPRFQKQIKGGVHGGANQNIHAENIKKATVPVISLDEQRRIVAYLDSVQARLASLRELQSETQEELSALLPSVLDRAFKGEL